VSEKAQTFTVSVPDGFTVEIRIRPSPQPVTEGDGETDGGTYADAWRDLYAGAKAAGIIRETKPPVEVSSGTVEGSDPRPSDNGNYEIARAMLADVGIDDPDGFLANYTPDRIIEVCTLAGLKKGKLRSVAGSINKALHRGWNR